MELIIKKILNILSITAALFLFLNFTAFAEKEEEREIVIGYSNSLHNNTWRQHMIEDSMKVFEYYKSKEMVDEIIIQHSGIDVKAQIRHIRYMIHQRVDCIIINPSSVSGLRNIMERPLERCLKNLE